MRKAYAYIRTSTTEQLDKSGPQRQKFKINNYASNNNIHIHRFFTEDISSTINHIARPVFTEMMKELANNAVDLIIVEDLSRLTRDTEVQKQILSFLATKDISLICANTGINVVDTARKDPTMKAMIQMQAVFNEWEKDNLVARLHRGRQISGHKGGRPAFYPKELKKRVRILRSKGNSYGQIATRLNLEEVKTSTGRPWTAQLVRIIAMEAK